MSRSIQMLLTSFYGVKVPAIARAPLDSELKRDQWQDAFYAPVCTRLLVLLDGTLEKSTVQIEMLSRHRRGQKPQEFRKL